MRLAELMNMHGRVALVTGGAGHIGCVIAATLAELGADLALLDIDGDGLDELARGLEKTFGTTVACITADLEDSEARSSVPDAVQRQFGRLDVLINNAAFVGSSTLPGWMTPFAEQSVETWRRAFEVNLTSVFDLSKAFSRLLIDSGNGVILNVASIYGVFGPDLRLYEGTGMGNPAAYAASKGGLIQLTRWLATVLAPEVRVNALSPGGAFRNQAEVFRERYAARTPLSRMATEDDFRGAVAYLASDMSRYVTGQNLHVDGGWGVW